MFGCSGADGGVEVGVGGMANQFVHVELERDGVWKVRGGGVGGEPALAHDKLFYFYFLFFSNCVRVP